MARPLVALQMNPLSQINVKTDTTFALGLEAQNQGYKLFVYTPDALSNKEGQIIARGSLGTFKDQSADFYTVEKEILFPLMLPPLRVYAS